MPWMRLRVVCGLRVTMASFSPTSAFNSVDLPALGRPMMETNPERNAMSGGPDLPGPEANAHAVHAALGGFEHLEAQSVLVEDFTRPGNVSREFAHQPGDGGRLFFIRPHPEQFLQQIDVGVAVEDVGRLVLLYDLCLFVLIADLADDLFDQIFDRDQATDTAVLINHDGHANIVALHLAQQFAPQLGFGNEVHIGFHQVANGLAVRLDIGNLQQVLGIDDAFDVIDIALVHRYARVGMFLHQIRQFVDRRADWNSDDLRPRRHNLPHRFVAELNHRLDEVAVALPQNAFFLAGFDQRVNRFRWMLWLLLRVFLGERRNGK